MKSKMESKHSILLFWWTLLFSKVVSAHFFTKTLIKNVTKVLQILKSGQKKWAKAQFYFQKWAEILYYLDAEKP